MDIDDLQAVLRERAEDDPSGRPDIEALLGKGQALRRRRRLAVAGAAGVAVAAVIAVPILVAGGSDSGSGPASIVPAVPPPTSAISPATPSPASPTPSLSPTPAPGTSAPPGVTVTLVPLASMPIDGTVTSQPVLVYGDCQTPSFEPSEVVTACADRGLFFRDLRWTSWTSTSATAIGTEVYKTCVPYCAAAGSQEITGATVTLSAPVRDSAGRLIWSEIQFSPQPPGYATGPYHGGPYPLPIRPD